MILGNIRINNRTKLIIINKSEILLESLRVATL